MSEKVQVQKNSSAPSQMAPSPQFQQRPFTDARYHPVTSDETISADSPPNIARASFTAVPAVMRYTQYSGSYCKKLVCYFLLYLITAGTAVI